MPLVKHYYETYVDDGDNPFIITFHHCNWFVRCAVKIGELLLLNPSPHWETDKRRKKSPLPKGRKRTTCRRIQIGQLGCHDIGRDIIGHMEH